jgi:dipeptidyl-peptidase-4
MKRALMAFGATLLLAIGLAAPLCAQVDYRRAEALLRASDLLSGHQVIPNWLPDGNRFWYRNTLEQGAEFVLVDPVRNTRRLVFDNARLAAAMSVARDTSYDPVKLPFSTFRFIDNERSIQFRTNDRLFQCVLATYACTVGDTLPDERPYVVSPDSTWEAFVHEYNVWLRPRGGGDSIQLTTDGTEEWWYGRGPARPFSVLRGDTIGRPNLAWSPDGLKLAVYRMDVRGVQRMHYISYTPQRPRHFSQPYALPGDTTIPKPGLQVLGLPQAITAAASDGDGPQAGVTNVRVELPVPASQLSLADLGQYVSRGPVDSTWNRTSDRVDFTVLTRGSQKKYVIEADAATGASRVLAGDSAPTFVEFSPFRIPPNWYVTESGETILWSDRDGWSHLYRFDRDGNVINQITSGPWSVESIHRVDEVAGQIYLTANGSEPDRLLYYRHLYRVNFDGSGLTLLTPEDANHNVTFTPSGRYFVDSYSRVESPPVTVLRAAADGRLIRELERADISRLAEIGWQPAEVFQVKARDGVTDLYGVAYWPPQIDSVAKHPIISHIYPGPQIGSVFDWNFKSGGEDFALAQLGFVVIQLNAMGTPFRSKGFHDAYYGNFGDNGLPDHIAAIKQLAARYPFIDIDRVGIYGGSGGGFSSTDAILRYPDFFKVAVSTSGNHDNRSYNIYWAEKYQGLMERDTIRNTNNFEASANQTLAGNLKGKLLLMHGDMDDNVHPANTIQLVNELIKANKDFDFIWAPNRGHGLGEPYFIRRRWDYFVRYLLGKEPPREYEFTPRQD